MGNQGYKIQIKAHDGNVSAYYGDLKIASSTHVNVLRETRLGDYYYFPKDAIDPNLLVKSDHQSFCPFKGTASYWHLNLPDGRKTNAVWSYEKPLEESAQIGGLISFSSDVVDHYAIDKPAPQLEDADGNISSPLSDWILRGAGACSTRRDFVRALGNKMVESGIAIYRMRIMLWSLHPQIAGVNYQWSRDTDEIEITEPGHDLFTNEAFINSPINLVTKGMGGVRQLLSGDSSKFEFPIMADLKEQGATDYVAMPLRFSDGQFNCITLACDHPDGFSTENLGLIFECVGVISRFLEVLTLRINTTTLLDTYLGQRTGQKVLAGDVRRGQGEDIRAVILFSDLRNSTGLAEILPRNEYLSLLNKYFDTVLEPVSANGGEVLKFIGDAVLAIFPISGDRKDQQRQAESALRAAQIAVGAIEDCMMENPGDHKKQVDLGISLHIGDVTYGNVGGADRLDFTVIGPAVNLAARLEDMCKLSGNRIIMSQDFKEALIAGDDNPPAIISVGSHHFEGIALPQSIYTPG